MTFPQAQSGFLTILPLEIRRQIYVIYMLQYIRHAPQSVANFGSWGESHESGHRGERLISYERCPGQGGSMPPLMRTCKRVADELRTIASQYLRFVIGSASTLEFDEKDSGVVMGLPPRCSLQPPTETTTSENPTVEIRHLQIEWRLNPQTVLPEHSLPEKRIRMLNSLQKIRQLFQDDDDDNNSTIRPKDKDTRPSLANLTSVRFDFVIPYEFAQHVAPRESGFQSYRFLNWAIEPVLDVIMHELPNFSPAIQTFEFTGIVGNKWLPMQQARLAERDIKMYRTHLNPRKRPTKHLQLHYICGEQDHVYRD